MAKTVATASLAASVKSPRDGKPARRKSAEAATSPAPVAAPAANVAPATEAAADTDSAVAPVAPSEKSALSDGNMVRRKSDYLWMLVILGGMAAAAQHFFPNLYARLLF